MIAEAHGKKIKLIKGFSWFLKILSHITGLVNKAFGSLVYEQSISEYKINYIVDDLKNSILKTEVESND